jgi:hypothetical protein
MKIINVKDMDLNEMYKNNMSCKNCNNTNCKNCGLDKIPCAVYNIQFNNDNKDYRELFVRLKHEFDELFTMPMQYVKYESEKLFKRIEIAHNNNFINDKEYEAIQKHIENKNKSMQKLIEDIEKQKIITKKEYQGFDIDGVTVIAEDIDEATEMYVNKFHKIPITIKGIALDEIFYYFDIKEIDLEDYKNVYDRKIHNDGTVSVSLKRPFARKYKKDVVGTKKEILFSYC